VVVVAAARTSEESKRTFEISTIDIREVAVVDTSDNLLSAVMIVVTGACTSEEDVGV
jgi:hypothetical protein